MFLRRLPLAQSGGLSTEMMMHFNGLKHVDRPAILAFPNIAGLFGLRRIEVYHPGQGAGAATSGCVVAINGRGPLPDNAALANCLPSTAASTATSRSVPICVFAT